MDRKGFTFLVKLYVYNRKYGMTSCQQLALDRIRGKLNNEQVNRNKTKHKPIRARTYRRD
jgi:hypothetical protein